MSRVVEGTNRIPLHSSLSSHRCGDESGGKCLKINVHKGSCDRCQPEMKGIPVSRCQRNDTALSDIISPEYLLIPYQPCICWDLSQGTHGRLAGRYSRHFTPSKGFGNGGKEKIQGEGARFIDGGTEYATSASQERLRVCDEALLLHQAGPQAAASHPALSQLELAKRTHRWRRKCHFCMFGSVRVEHKLRGRAWVVINGIIGQNSRVEEGSWEFVHTKYQ
jgi:hypothetical protein